MTASNTARMGEAIVTKPFKQVFIEQLRKEGASTLTATIPPDMRQLLGRLK